MDAKHTLEDNITSLVSETLRKISTMNADDRHKELAINDMILTLQTKRAFGKFNPDSRKDIDNAINKLFLSLIYFDTTERLDRERR